MSQRDLHCCLNYKQSYGLFPEAKSLPGGDVIPSTALTVSMPYQVLKARLAIVMLATKSIGGACLRHLLGTTAVLYHLPPPCRPLFSSPVPSPYQTLYSRRITILSRPPTLTQV